MKIDGSEKHALATNLGRRSSQPAWSPDGEIVAAVLEGENGDGSGETIMLLDSSSGEPVGEIVPNEPGFIRGLSWTPDASQILFDWTAPKGPQQGIYSATPDRSSIERLSSCSQPGCSDLYPSVSPDGTLFTFTRGRCEEPGGDCSFGDVMVALIDGSDLRKLTSGSALDCCSAWQPIPSGAKGNKSSE